MKRTNFKLKDLIPALDIFKNLRSWSWLLFVSYTSLREKHTFKVLLGCVTRLFFYICLRHIDQFMFCHIHYLVYWERHYSLVCYSVKQSIFFFKVWRNPHFRGWKWSTWWLWRSESLGMRSYAEPVGKYFDVFLNILSNL